MTNTTQTADAETAPKSLTWEPLGYDTCDGCKQVARVAECVEEPCGILCRACRREYERGN